MNYMVVLLSVFLLTIGTSFAKQTFSFDNTMTVRELAKANNFNTRKLIHELDEDLGLLSVKPDAIVEDIGLTRKQFKKIYLHMHEDLTPLVIFGMSLWVIIAAFVIILLKKKKLTRTIRVILFLFVILFFGIFLHAKPCAMETMVKFFKATVGRESWHLRIIFLSFFTLFGVIASNLFCSIGCQIGVMQDLIFQLFRMKKIKHKKLPFWLTNGIRVLTFLMFLLFMYNILDGFKTCSLYHDVNIFKVYILSLTTIGLVTFISVILLSSIVYRPYCSLICPFGVWSWITSHLSILRIKIRHDECTQCGKCVEVCPNDAMKGILENKKIKHDCYLCGECLNQCPTKCIELK